MKKKFRVQLKPKYIYVLSDTTDDEHYYTLGTWLDLNEAVAAVKSCHSPADFGGDSWTPHDYGTFTVEIHRHRIGWGNIGKTVFKRTYIETYDEAKDKYKWEIEK